jgi:integrase
MLTVTRRAGKLQAGLSAKTVNNHLTVLSMLLKVARDWELIRTLPAIRLLKANEPTFRFLSFEEAVALVDHAAPEWRAMVFVALRTGLRLGELRALRWADVDLKGARIVVRQAAWGNVIDSPKSGKSREVPLGDAVRRALQGHKHLRGDFVFCQEDGAMLTKGVCKHPLWRAAERAGLGRIGWHVLRHTFASHLVMRGASMKQVQELLGHADIKMTMRYAHLSPEARREAVALLDMPVSDTSGTWAAHGERTA